MSSDSSDSEASHSSAQREDEQDDIVNVDSESGESPGHFLGPKEVETGHNNGEDTHGEELESMASDDNGLTFARVRSRGAPQEEEQTASELSFRPKIERAGSVESASTPDDTPSVQVRTQYDTRSNTADYSRTQSDLHSLAACLYLTAP
jgi:phage protein D